MHVLDVTVINTLLVMDPSSMADVSYTWRRSNSHGQVLLAKVRGSGPGLGRDVYIDIILAGSHAARWDILCSLEEGWIPVLIEGDDLDSIPWIWVVNYWCMTNLWGQWFISLDQQVMWQAMWQPGLSGRICFLLPYLGVCSSSHLKRSYL